VPLATAFQLFSITWNSPSVDTAGQRHTARVRTNQCCRWEFQCRWICWRLRVSIRVICPRSAHWPAENAERISETIASFPGPHFMCPDPHQAQAYAHDLHSSFGRSDDVRSHPSPRENKKGFDAGAPFTSSPRKHPPFRPTNILICYAWSQAECRASPITVMGP